MDDERRDTKPILVTYEVRCRPLVHIEGLTNTSKYMFVGGMSKFDSIADFVNFFKQNPDIANVRIAPSEEMATQWVDQNLDVALQNNQYGCECDEDDDEYMVGSPSHMIHQRITISRVNRVVDIWYNGDCHCVTINCSDLETRIGIYSKTYIRGTSVELPRDMSFEERKIFYIMLRKIFRR